LRRGDKEKDQKQEEKRTDTGRTVYGGGGIAPDVTVKIPATEIELQRIWTEPVFQFTRNLVSGQVPGLAEFRIDRAADHGHHLASTEYQVNDKVLAAFKAYVRDHKDIKVEEAQFEKDAEWLKRQIRFEVVTAAYGQEVARGALAAGDMQLQRAIQELPTAKSLVEDIRRIRASSSRRN